MSNRRLPRALRRAAAQLAAAVAACAVAAPELRGQDRAPRATLRVAVYSDDAPFARDGRGIDVDLAVALAERLGMTASVAEHPADETMSDDLRRILWRGRLADVLMHVPADPRFAKANPEVTIVAPYFRETEVVARDVRRLPNFATAFDYGHHPIGVEEGSLPDYFLLSAVSGRFREQVVHFSRASDAVAALREGRVASVVARRAQVEAALGPTASPYAVTEAALPGVEVTAWDVGIGVRAVDSTLAASVPRAMGAMTADGTVARIFRSHGVTYVAPRRPAGGTD